MNSFTKKDLKTGMMVFNKYGQRAIVLLGTANGDILAGDFWHPLSNYNDDLKDENSSNGKDDIMEIYLPKYNCDYLQIKNNNIECRGNLIWERLTNKKENKK